MLKPLITAFVSLIAISGFAASTQPLPLNKVVEDREFTDSNGAQHKLSEFAGKTVVLEWTNYGCPFVRKHYDSKNMQALQAKAAADGVVWLSVISSAKGEQGYYEPTALNEANKKEGNVAAFTIVDPDGTLGRYFVAKTTPHMYILNGKRELVYQGGIDGTKSTEVEDVKPGKDYVTAALADLKAGRKVAKASTDAYGCGVKYKK